MTPPAALWAALPIGYALGSIPFGLLLTRAAGLGDIRQVGSGNIGATNVLRTGRRDVAAATLLLDAGKGAAAVWLSGGLALAGLGAVLGHCFPVWLGFRGGKGVATGLGVFAALDGRLAVACAGVWLAVAAVTRLSSGGALAAFAAAPAIAALLGLAAWPAVGAIALLVWLMHRANLRRILAGTEPRIGERARPA